MKKNKLLFFSILSVFLFFSINNVYAQDWWGIIKGLELRNSINLIINAVLALVGTVALLFLIIGGYQYITSSGNSEAIEKAKKTILYSIIGLIVAILSFIIINAVISSLIK